MKAIAQFQKKFISDGKRIDSTVAGITGFQKENSIFFLKEGVINSTLKNQIEKLFANSKQEMVFVSIMKDRKQMAAEPADPDWNSYAWFVDEPDHIIHFD